MPFSKSHPLKTQRLQQNSHKLHDFQKKKKGVLAQQKICEEEKDNFIQMEKEQSPLHYYPRPYFKYSTTSRRVN